jgi:hypothetical protein
MLYKRVPTKFETLQFVPSSKEANISLSFRKSFEFTAFDRRVNNPIISN